MPVCSRIERLSIRMMVFTVLGGVFFFLLHGYLLWNFPFGIDSNVVVNSNQNDLIRSTSHNMFHYPSNKIHSCRFAVLTSLKSDIKAFSKYLASTLYGSNTCNVDIIAMTSPKGRFQQTDVAFEIVSGEPDSFIRGAAFANVQAYDAVIIHHDLGPDLTEDKPEVTTFLQYLNVPSILVVHGSTSFLTTQKLFILRSLVSKVTKIVVLSPYDAKNLEIGYGLPRDKITAINHAYYAPCDHMSHYNAKNALDITRNKAVLAVVKKWGHRVIPSAIYIDNRRLDQLDVDKYHAYLTAADTLITYEYEILNKLAILQYSSGICYKHVAYVPFHVLPETVAGLLRKPEISANVAKAYHCLIESVCDDVEQDVPVRPPLPTITDADIMSYLSSTRAKLLLLVDMGIKIHGMIAGGIRSLNIAIVPEPGIQETFVVVHADSPVVFLTSDSMPNSVKIRSHWRDDNTLEATIAIDNRYAIRINATTRLIDMSVTPLSPHVFPRGLVGLLMHRLVETRSMDQQIADFVVADDERRAVDQVWKNMDVFDWPSMHIAAVKHHHTLRVVLQGPYVDPEGLAVFNREIGRQLISSDDFQFYPQQHRGDMDNVSPLSDLLGNYTSDLVPDGVDVWIRSYWPADFSTPTQAKKLVMIQPWAFGVIPAQWVRDIGNVDEVWVPTQFVKRQFVDSGVPPGKLVVIGLGVPEKFKHPDVEPLQLNSRCASKSFRFLYHDALLPRKGIDILLRAYMKEFSADNDVCLVIHSTYGNGFQLEMIDQLESSSDIAVQYIDGFMSERHTMALYAACHVLVAPHRSEGYGLYVAEAMAMGLPVIVTDRGPASDFVGMEHGWFIPSKPVSCDYEPCDHKFVHNMPVAKSMKPWWLQPDAEALGKLMRYAMSHPIETSSKGRAAREHVLRTQSWDIVGEIVRARLQNL